MTVALQRLPRRGQPRWAAPMLAVLTEERFSSEQWIFERKLDGDRCLAFRRGADLRLLSRTRKQLNGTYPELVEALSAQACDGFVVDGEVVAFEGAQTSFARLQQRMQLRDPKRARRSGVRVLRSRDWLKFKCVSEQEFVIGGYTDPGGRRVGFGALLVGHYDARGRLRFAGNVGTGYSDVVLRDLSRRLARLEQAESPFAADQLSRAAVHWVRPELVAQIRFTELTGDGKLRHPRFLGLRRDKPPREVVLGRPTR